MMVPMPVFDKASKMKIAVLPGDGIGTEVIAEAVKVLRAVLPGDALDLCHGDIGESGLDTVGDALPPATVDLARQADAVLLGGTGIPGDDKVPNFISASGALLRLRKQLGLFANYRPALLFPQLAAASTLKPEVIEGLDILIIRELSSDLYFGEPRGIEQEPSGQRIGINTMRYTEAEISRIAHVAFRAARSRRGKLTSVDKANVLEAMQLWREIVEDTSRDYPDVELEHLFVDAAAMALMRDPKRFDVILAGNVFGDILSDAAAMLTGSIGMLPSASLSDGTKGLYEPVHGTAPDIAGKGIANPLAAILSAAMMLRLSFGLRTEAAAIEAAVRAAIDEGLRTADIFSPGTRRVGTSEMGDAVAAAVRRQSALPGARMA